MISIKRAVIAGAVVAMMASSAFAQLSATYADWAKGPVQYLMTPDEQSQWKNVKTDEEAKAFVDLFWAKRDPSPATPNVNEFQIEFDRRVKTADDNFSLPKKKGSMTERGKYLIALGVPTKIINAKAATAAGANSNDDDPTGARAASAPPKQVWTYEKATAGFDTGKGNLEFTFADVRGNGDWVVERGGRDASAAIARANQAAIKSPNLTEAPKAAAAKPATPAPVAVSTAPATTSTGAIKTESLRSAIAEYKAAATKPYKAASVYFTELVSPSGEPYIPLQLYIPKSAGLTADAVTTFFGVLEDASGAPVIMFEEPAKLSTSGGDLYFDKAINVAPGKYTATLGLSGTDGKPVVMSSTPVEIRNYGKDTVGVSRLVLAQDMHETEAAAPAGAPYAFGKLKIVPKGDRVFTNKDEISYFVEIFNPGIDETTQMPKIQVKLELSGTVKGKAAPTITAPLTEASALPLSGRTGPGNFAIIGSIPLGEMKNPPQPGDYNLKVSVHDQVTKQKYAVDQSFTLVAAPAAAATPAK